MRRLVDTAVESISLEREKQQLWLEDEADKIRHPNPTILQSDSDKIVGIGEIAMKKLADHCAFQFRWVAKQSIFITSRSQKRIDEAARDELGKLRALCTDFFDLTDTYINLDHVSKYGPSLDRRLKMVLDSLKVNLQMAKLEGRQESYRRAITGAKKLGIWVFGAVSGVFLLYLKAIWGLRHFLDF